MVIDNNDQDNDNNHKDDNDKNDNDDNNGFPLIFDDFGMDLRLSGALKTLVFLGKSIHFE